MLDSQRRAAAATGQPRYHLPGQSAQRPALGQQSAVDRRRPRRNLAQLQQHSMMLPENIGGKEKSAAGGETAPSDGDSHSPDTQLKLACPECGAWGMVAMRELAPFVLLPTLPAMVSRRGGILLARSRRRRPSSAFRCGRACRSGKTTSTSRRPRARRRKGAWRWLSAAKCRPWTAGVSLAAAVSAGRPVAVDRLPPAAAACLSPWKTASRFGSTLGLPRRLHGWCASRRPATTANCGDGWSAIRSPTEYDRNDLSKSQVRLTSVTPRGDQWADITAEVRIAGRNGRQGSPGVQPDLVPDRRGLVFCASLPRIAARAVTAESRGFGGGFPGARCHAAVLLAAEPFDANYAMSAGIVRMVR